MISGAEEFLRLRTSDDPVEYRRSAADDATEETWNEIIDHFPEMIEWVAHNKTISVPIIRRLFAVGDDKVRLILAMKRATPSDLLLELCNDPNGAIRLAVARHPKAPIEVRSKLGNDSWDRVREAVSQREWPG